MSAIFPSTQATSNIEATDKNISLTMGFGMKYSYPCSGTIVANGFLGAKISDEIDLGYMAATVTVHCPSTIKVSGGISRPISRYDLKEMCMVSLLLERNMNMITRFIELLLINLLCFQVVTLHPGSHG